jgi:hypothetical protein
MTPIMKAFLAELEKLGILPVEGHEIPNIRPGKPHHAAGDVEAASPAQKQAALGAAGKLGARTRYYYDDGIYFLHPVDGEGAGPGDLDFYEDAGGQLITPPGPITPLPIKS